MRLLYSTVLLCVSALVSAAAHPSLDNVLSRMDEASASFKGVSANIRRLTHTAVLNDNSEETGTMAMLRVKPGDVRMLIEFVQPDPKSYSFQNRRAQIYYPKIQQVEIYDLGKHSKLVDQFLLLGFGTPGRELMKSYTVKVLGEENAGGQRTVKLELTPKLPEVAEHLNKVELWLAEDAAYPVQQKFYQTSGDYVFITYSDIKLNPPLTPEAVALKLPNNVRKVTPQK